MTQSRLSGERLVRVFDVLELLVGRREGMTATEIGRRLDLPLSSTHNLLQRLVASDLVVLSAGPRYTVGSRLVRLGIQVVDGLEIRVLARKPLHDLAVEIGDTTYLAVRLGRRVVYVDRAQGTRSTSVDIQLGQDLYLHATAVGKLFAAFDPGCRRRMLGAPRPRLTDRTLVDRADLELACTQVLRNGYALSCEEAVLGVVGVAVPVFGAGEEIAGAIHVSSLAGQMDPVRQDVVVSAALATASVVERGLGRLPLL